jgi:glycosyltransferase involved in cell wall biosynthesis
MQERSLLVPRNIHVVRSPTRHAPQEAEVVVGITVHNNARTIRRCLESVLNQDVGTLKVSPIILDDQSTDGWIDASADLVEELDAVVLSATCGSAASARNAILDYVAANLQHVGWVARLDGDDRLTDRDSLRSVCGLASELSCEFVLGGNRLVQNGAPIEKTNPASQDLMRPGPLLELLRNMAEGTAHNELPSCNLLMSPHAGWRYPETRSAEDHWLVAMLLIHHADRGAILNTGFYSDYSLGGPTTVEVKASGESAKSRSRLYEAARRWLEGRESPHQLLGFGNESVVLRVGDTVEKRFFSWALDAGRVTWLREALVDCAPFLPQPEWTMRGDTWIAAYPYEETEAVASVEHQEIEEFLRFCLNRRIVCKNIKRANLRRRRGGGLLYIDLGASIMPMDVDYFRDSAARLYGIGALGYADDELRRRHTTRRQTEILREIPGFEAFYAGLLESRAKSVQRAAIGGSEALRKSAVADVTLMIKACPMDAHVVSDQARHIVARLETPRRFAEVVLLIDSYEGPFLRAYAEGDLARLMREARALIDDGVVDRAMVAPSDPASTIEVNKTWFDIDCTATHTLKGVPLTPQLWGFDQVATRYVLQCDIDTFVGRLDAEHDYLADMLEAVSVPDVLGIAFNIPHSPDAAWRPYDAPLGDYVPEVRCGLLDLRRLKEHRPFANRVEDGRPVLTWYRSVQWYQQSKGLRTLRGGDPRSFYVHPPLEYKKDRTLFARIRDLVGQALVPPVQYDQWDIGGSSEDWQYPTRTEKIIFLVRGRGTPRHKFRRCVASLLAQDDQSFGIIVMDDASGPRQSVMLRQEAAPLWQRTSLVCNTERRGHIPNTLMAVSGICRDPETLVVILDQDDALMDTRVVSILKQERRDGHDVVLAAMFRPDKPLKVYHPDFKHPRETYGGEVWIHLRAFTKAIFERIPIEALKLDGEWIPECEDYAIMIPAVELARSPVYVPMYLYHHERSTSRKSEVRARKDALIRGILASRSFR